MGTLLVNVVIWTALVAITNGGPVKSPMKMTRQESGTLNSLVKDFNGTWISDSEFIIIGKEINIFNAETRRQTTLVSSKTLSSWSGESYTFSPNNKRVLIRYSTESIFRHSMVAKYKFYDFELGQIFKISNDKKLQLCLWTPTSDRLVYVLDNNVYVRHPNGTEEQLTTEGVNGVIYIGIPDWVYEEEVLGTGGAIWFSPDGTKIAVAYFDDTEVKTYTYPVYGDSFDRNNQYPKELHIKYPKPGTPNPKVQLKVIDLTATEKGWTELKAPISVVSKDNILKSVTWSDKDNVLAVWENRRQNIASIQSCHISGSCKEIIKLSEPKGWIAAGNPMCLPSGNNCLMTNWIGNWYQIWNLDLSAKKNIWESLGDFTVQKIYGYDESTKELFYQATTKQDTSEVHVYKNDKCLSCSLQDIDGVPCKHASASFSKKFFYYALTCEGPTPGYTIIFESKTNERILDWELNELAREELAKYLLPKTEILQIPTGDGLTASVKIHFPPNINLKSPKPGKTYPLVIDVYGGPNHVRVKNSFSVGLPAYYSASRDFIYAIVDPRGSGNKGKKSVYILNNHLGTVEIQDEYKVAKSLVEKYSFIDPKRVAIWGWSYGGYTSALTLARDKDHVFKCGISVAPVVNWIYYDSIYTERYMGFPTKDDNLENYNASDITNSAKGIDGHKFLLIHGSGDDNVHVQQTMMLASKLQKNDILFEEMIYTDEAHGISNFFGHVMETISEFWKRCLE